MELKKYTRNMKIKDVAQIVNGATPSTSNETYYDGNVVWITPKDLSDNNSKYIRNGARNTQKKGLIVAAQP